MSVPDLDGFRARFSQFSAVTDDAISVWFVEAALRFTPARFGAQWPMATYLFAAHNLVQFPETSTGDEATARGPVTSESVGDVSRSYGDPFDASKVPASLMEFATTSYGRRLIGIVLSRSAARGRVIRTGSSEGAW